MDHDADSRSDVACAGAGPSCAASVSRTPSATVRREHTAAGTGAAGAGRAGGVTYAHQDDLPSLPVPPLNATLDKYLKTARPFLKTDEEWEHTRRCVEDFRKGDGPALQKLLEDKASEERNWLEEWWENYAYLAPRYPAAVNINWHGVLPGDWNEPMEQVEGTALFISHILKFRRALYEETLEPEVMAGQKLCMNQYTRMFNSCKVPHEGMDEIVTYDEPANYVIVMRNDAMYKVQVLDEDGETMSLNDLIWELDEVVKHSSRLFGMGRTPPVSVLTSENRDNWAAARDHMCELDKTNLESFETIQRALFVVVMSNEAPTTVEEIANLVLAGDGRDKWYDKPFCMMTFANGRGGLNGEHAWADAMVLVKCFDSIMETLDTHMRTLGPPKRGERSAAAVKPEQLQWAIDTKARIAIEKASSAIAKLCADVDLKTLVFRHYGKDLLKAYRCMPDFFIQMALQLALARLHPDTFPWSTYESAHTRLFYHGRTETIRTVSEDSVAFVHTMLDKDSSDSQKFKALKQAIDTHFAYVKDCAMGMGVDRHLMGLYIVSEMSGISPRPSLFTDVGMLRSKEYRLSTSNISMGASPMFGGFAPIVKDGYGVCYGIEADLLKFSVCAFKSGGATDASKMRASIEAALMDMQEVLLTRNVIYLAEAKPKSKL